jgi:hypothetical protein
VTRRTESRVVYAVAVTMLVAHLIPTVAPAVEDNTLSCLVCERRGVKIAAPFIRITVTEIGMLAVAGAIWPEGYNPIRVRINVNRFRESWTAPPEYDFTQPFFASDNDWWYFNVFAHGLFGSEGYLSGRGMGHGPLASFGFALFASFSWEYLVEGFFKHPSAIDLFWTPAAGALLGELRFQLYRLISNNVKHKRPRLLLQILLDPIGELQRVMLGCRD